ncbi:MAG: uracil-DNA glycosylase, partial [Proteobacteria bacterium]
PAAAPTLSPSESLSTYAEKIRYCQDCGLHIGRQNLVFGRGESSATIAFVGDVPSLEDDRQGLPFSDAAGALLDKMVIAMKLKPESVYLTNIFKCRPPGNQKPDQDLFRLCESHLKAQFQHLQATTIVAMGDAAAKALANSESPLKTLRGQEFSWEGRRVFVTHHPRDLLTSPAMKKEAWSDLQGVMRALGMRI